MSLDIPRNAADQLDIAGPRNNYASLTHSELHVPLVALMREAGVRLLASDCRTKTLQRWREKLNRRGWENPVTDVHAARLILNRSDFRDASVAVFQKWPTPPEVYPGLESFRDYSRSQTRDSYNSFSDSDYKATHLNIHVPFGARIAEIQLFTVEDYRFYIATQAAYLARQRGVATH